MDNFAILIQNYAQPSKHGSHQIHTTGYLKSGLKINGIVLKIELEMFENAKFLFYAPMLLLLFVCILITGRLTPHVL